MSQANSQKRSSLQAELENIKLLAKYFRSASGVVTVLITAFPLSGFLESSLVPVWSAATLLAFSLSLFAIAFVFFASRDATIEGIRNWAKKITVVGGIILFIYFCLNWLCIYEKEDARVVTGFMVTDEARNRVSQGMADSLARADLLASFGYDYAELAWKDARIIGLAINSAFCAGCVALSTGFFSFILLNIALDTERATIGSAKTL